MSETKEQYGDGEINIGADHEIRDEAPIGHFSQIPNMVDDMGLTPFAYRLYGHLKRVTGENGKCWQSTETISKACGMSMGAVSKAKKELENVWPPLIRVTSQKKGDGRIYHEIFITDIWKINNSFYTEKDTLHVVKGLARSPGETYPSRGESKNNPPEQEEPNAGAKPAPLPVPGMSIENQIAMGVENIVMPTGDQEYQNKIEMAMMNICKGARNIQPLALAFLTTRGIFPSKSEYLGWRKAFLQMYEKHVTAENVVEAIGRLLHDNMTVVEPYAVIKTAVSLANPPPETPPVTFSDVSV